MSCLYCRTENAFSEGHRHPSASSALAAAAKFREKSTAPGSRGHASAIRVKAVERPAEPGPDLLARLAAINAKVPAGYSPALPKTNSCAQAVCRGGGPILRGDQTQGDGREKKEQES
jgi:hypothetical protein